MASILTEENFRNFAIQAYTNYRCTGIEEFEEDLLHIKYLKKILKKSASEKHMDIGKMRLALNHLIILYNVFKKDAVTRMLFFKMAPKQYSILKTFLIHMSFMPSMVPDINGKNIESKNIKINQEILEKLRVA